MPTRSETRRARSYAGCGSAESGIVDENVADEILLLIRPLLAAITGPALSPRQFWRWLCFSAGWWAAWAGPWQSIEPRPRFR